MTAPVVVARGLRKSYGDLTVLDGVDLDVAQGEVLALLGPNGAGKTTTVRILSTLLRPDAGTAYVAGQRRRRAGRGGPRGDQPHWAVRGRRRAADRRREPAAHGRLAHLGMPEVRTRSAELLELFDLTDAGEAASCRPTRAACGAGSTSPSGCWPARRSSSSTSRPPASTRAAATSSGT